MTGFPMKFRGKRDAVHSFVPSRVALEMVAEEAVVAAEESIDSTLRQMYVSILER